MPELEPEHSDEGDEEFVFDEEGAVISGDEEVEHSSEEEAERRYGSVGRGQPPLAAARQDTQRPIPGRSSSGPGVLQAGTLGSSTSHRKCNELIKKYQLRTSGLEAENKGLRLELATAHGRMKVLAKNQALPSGKLRSSNADDEWGNLANKCVIFVSPFTSDAWFDGTCRTVSILWLDRFLSPENNILCTRMEVLDALPQKYHKYLEKSGTRAQQFKHAGDDFFRQKIKGLRGAGSHIFVELGLPHLSMFYGFGYSSERGGLPEFRRLLEWPAGSEEAKEAGNFFLPIHFPDGVLDFSKVFQVKWMSLNLFFQVLRSLLFGPASADPKAVADPNWKAPAVCNGRKWGVSEVNPAALALAAIIGPFMHNRDASIEAVGPHSRFEYMNAYDFFKQFFLENLIEGGESKDTMLDLFAWHNGHIFPKARGAVDEGGTKKIANDNVKAAARKAFKARSQGSGPPILPPTAQGAAAVAAEDISGSPALPGGELACAPPGPLVGNGQIGIECMVALGTAEGGAGGGPDQEPSPSVPVAKKTRITKKKGGAAAARKQPSRS
ncbi:hypothetical protein FA13DRAFT_1796086 [Coprinellus micaceus]|uniref:Uncharacterized protein n=1 Tax=Coprinellus micaceus TaxID=71717 RepID=A0A4Y7SVX5_COPMI|nr:hypothetical protein FA13DRAFT_1796086 [Coprinellus micaceus]